MKKLVLITAIFSQILFAQQNDLSVDMNPVAESNVNWETTLTLNAQNGMENGFLIEIPSGIKMVPMKARINQDDMFLQNQNDIPSKETIVCWTLLPEGLAIFFRDGQFNSGDQIEITTMTTLIKKNSDQEVRVNIRSVNNIESVIQISEDVKSSTIVSLKIEN